MAFPTVLILLLGSSARLWLFRSTTIARWLGERNEFVTPLTSWKRVTEGLVLSRTGVSPYSGDVFHETPLMLKAVDFMENILGADKMWMTFWIADMLTIVILGAVTTSVGQYLLKRQDMEKKGYNESADKLLLQSKSVSVSRFYVIATYALNPLTVASCVSMSMSVFHNLIMSTMFLCMIKGNRLLVCTLVALTAYETTYGVMLIVPAAILLAQRETGTFDLSTKLSIASIIQTVVCFVCACVLLLFASRAVNNDSWDFLRSTYGFVLSVPDLTPNIGIFWYFFTEVFDHFRTFFVFVFQMHAFIYVAPLTIRLRQHPLFLAYILLAISAVFRSYPSLADTAFYLSMLPMWRHLTVYMRNEFIAGVMFIVGVILAPPLWYLWTGAGSANANFYFAATLVICTAQVFMLTDILFAFLRREHDLVKGVKPLTSDGKPAMIILD